MVYLRISTPVNKYSTLAPSFFLRTLILLQSDCRKIDHFDLVNNLTPFLKGVEIVK